MYTDGHVPRLWKAGLLLVLGTLAVSVGSSWHWSVSLLGGALALMGAAEAVTLYYKSLADTRDSLYRVQKEIIVALSNTDAEVRNAIAVKLPSYRFEYSGGPLLQWEDTPVPYAAFKEFLAESNDRYTVAQRDWKSKSAEYHRYWLMIYARLVARGLVLANSSNGSHSEQWINNGYKKAWEYWGRLPGGLQELE